MENPYLDLVGKVLKLSPEIRFASISNMFGEIKYSKNKTGVKLLLTHKESRSSLESATRSWNLRNSLSPKIGKGEFVIAQYGKIKRITIPLGPEHLLYLTTTKKADHNKIIKKATKLKLGKLKKKSKVKQKLVIP